MTPSFIRENYPILLTRRQVLEVLKAVGGGGVWTIRQWKKDGLLQPHILPGCKYGRYKREAVLSLLFPSREPVPA